MSALKLTLLGIVILISAYAADQGRDLAFRVHGFLILLVSAGLFLWTLRKTDTPRPAVAMGDYQDDVVRAGVLATAFWGIAGLLVGVIIALQLTFPALNFDWAQPFGNFGRLRPLHTSAVIFAFGGNALIASSIYIVQRTSRTRLFGGNAVWFVFWGYQLFIVLAATGYLLGANQSKEYAEPEWYVDIWLTVVWVVYLVVFFGTILRRKERHIYVANWFFLAFIITVAMLHVVNNLALPVSIWGSKSVQLFGGVQDAMTQWWYGHNAVGFFLTAGFLGMMYYYVPKQANRPVYSYKLSIVHFWALIFLYIWAGPHHLHYTALPDWASTLGMVFSVILWMPSWAGMMNGLMTLNGAWDKIRTDPIIRFLVASLAFYGMSTFEGPMMSIRAVNALSHYTDWTVGHVHSGALGWNGMIIFAMIYFLTPRLWNRGAMYSTAAMNWHFWCAMVGIVMYAASMWVSGIMEGLMWREVDDQGFLVNSFADTVDAKFPMYLVRSVGGILYLAGAGIMVWNMWMTIRGTARTTQAVAQMTPPAGEGSAPAAPIPATPAE
ncbi:cytochrome-c oxidase, cbb3-type subunit I [Pseudooctadecabacter jejudonensis]|uniref:cytochrome-c oxidase n=1 Tax=Pseudooctadecabacter jejudonensis TaxID=1391910 RepID=A0A1Y5SZE9_9RHOB|nr:cytochrome-c oxidase, cbb3-type subunit I [Pseudooctadecabacter jejudonensis]SLN48617.1 hypothetical protein PSJ8397_02496 [Pseudooctadecabacter jejudonensis]